MPPNGAIIAIPYKKDIEGESQMIGCNAVKNLEREIIVRIDPEVEDLIPGYLRNREDDVKAMTTALETGDYEKIRVLGHGMKGSGGGYGFEEITNIGREIEQSAKIPDWENIRRKIEELADYLNRVKVCHE